MRLPNDDRHPRASASAEEAPNVHLLKELTRLESRDYSEEGIPVFLACENLVGSGSSKTAPALAALNRSLSTTFRRYTDALPLLRPNLKETDVAKLVELLAERDFTAGGRRIEP